jgi:hypothetical protein
VRFRTSGQGIFDPDIDSRQRPPVEPNWSLSECQRLIANPALALLVCLAAYLAIRQALIVHHVGLFVFGLILFVVPLPLGQYHCLDCGATGWAFRAGRHACPAVVARQHHPDVGWVRIPRLRTQFKIWLVLVVLTLLLFAILGSPRH